MTILGIDPGTRRVGYGAITYDKKTFTLIDAGLLPVTSSNNIEALAEIRGELKKLIQKIRPDALAIEKLYFSKNQKTALAVSEARGVILATAHEEGLSIQEFNPNDVKLGVTGYGKADKKAVLKMVRLTLKEPLLQIIDDASDALALAIMGAQTRGLNYTQREG